VQGHAARSRRRIKVLPSHLALDPDLRERFEREAKAVAAQMSAR
jgi:hypothetical protein